jgi:hypothetical protein
MQQSYILKRQKQRYFEQSSQTTSTLQLYISRDALIHEIGQEHRNQHQLNHEQFVKHNKGSEYAMPHQLLNIKHRNVEVY